MPLSSAQDRTSQLEHQQPEDFPLHPTHFSLSGDISLPVSSEYFRASLDRASLSLVE
jgi:hypothetical protein